MKRFLKYILTGLVVALAVLAVRIKYADYLNNPWTRDGQVRADVIQIASRVTGPIVNLPIQDNQFVKAGDVLFEIDPRTFQASLDQARANLDETSDSIKVLEKQIDAANAGVDSAKAVIVQAHSSIAQLDATIAKNKAQYQRQTDLIAKKATSQRMVESAKATYEVSIQEQNSARASLLQAEAALLESKASLAEAQAKLGAVGKDNAQLRAAQAAVESAELNLEFTQVKAPVDGYVTNLNLRLGSQTVASQPSLALVDVSSYWISGFFRENDIEGIKTGDQAVVTLMSYPDSPLEGRVDSLGWGIAQQDGSTGSDLLPSISPTFEWIRLAQRVPVRVHLTNPPESIPLRVGTTCSVLVVKGSAENGELDKPLPPAPKALQ